MYLPGFACHEMLARARSATQKDEIRSFKGPPMPNSRSSSAYSAKDGKKRGQWMFQSCATNKTTEIRATEQNADLSTGLALEIDFCMIRNLSLDITYV